MQNGEFLPKSSIRLARKPLSPHNVSLCLRGGQLWYVFFLILFACLFGALSAQAEEKRIALLIGNNDYPASVGRLANTHSDVDKLKASLETTGFDVITAYDKDKIGMLTSIDGFLKRVELDSLAGHEVIAFFYYSGHGVSLQKDGQRRNYLLPAKENIGSRLTLTGLGIDLNDLISTFGSTQAKAFFVVSDACRNELEVSFSKSVGNKGFGAVPQRPGMLVAFSTAAGSTAPDDGKFAEVLAEKIKTPGVRAEVSFIDALSEVSTYRSLSDRPFMSAGRLPKNFCFAGCDVSKEEADWLNVKEINAISAYRFYLNRYPNGLHTTEAKAAIEKLEKDHQPQPKPTPTPSPTYNPEQYNWNIIHDHVWNSTPLQTSLSRILTSFKVSRIQDAAEKSDLRATSLLGYAYTDARYGLTPDNGTALYYLNTACDQNEPAACYTLGYFHETGKIVERDHAKAHDYLVRACDRNHLIGCNHLAGQYFAGRGVKKDQTKARELHQLACDSGYKWSCSNLGFYLYNGIGGSKDKEKGISYLTKACNENVSQACQDLKRYGQ